MYINNENNTEIKSYSEVKLLYPDTSFPKQGQPIVQVIWYFINPTPKPSYDVYTERIASGTPTKSGGIYSEVWNVEQLNLSPEELTARDDGLRVSYEDSMTRTMLEAQVEALGEPQGFRFLQGMSRLSHLVNKKENGDTLNQEETDYIDGSKVGLDYQETNALAFSTTMDEIALLSGGDIVSHTMPDFTMNPATQTGYQPYKDYLAKGFSD